MTVPKHPPLFGGRMAWMRRWAWLHIRRHKGELCQFCGGRMRLVWYAPESLWIEVTGYQVALVCPRCFDRIAEGKNILLTWKPVIMARRVEGETRVMESDEINEMYDYEPAYTAWKERCT